MTLQITIDLGTSHFRAGLAGEQRIISEPCTIARKENGKLIIGAEAERMVGRHPDSVTVTHPFYGGSVKDFDGTVAVLKYIVEQLIPNKWARRFDITLAVPNMLTPVERRALQEAARMAGARRVELFDTLVAAAIGANLPIDQPTGCLLVSLGAGSTEVALLSLGGIVDSRRVSIGGRTVDEEIMNWVRRELAFLIGVHTAENLKCQSDTTAETPSFAVKGRHLETGLPQEIKIPSTVVKDSLVNYYETIVSLIVQTIEACPPELVGDIMDRGIVLVGGGANEVNVLKHLTFRTEVPIIVADVPETCVIRGLMRAKRTSGRVGSSKSGSKIPSLFANLSMDKQSWREQVQKLIGKS